jgi:hypothetical protein
MKHVALTSVPVRPVTPEEATTLRLPVTKSPPELDEWRRILFQAADILDHFGWCRQALEFEHRHCAIGAILAAYHYGEDRYAGSIHSNFLREPALRWIAQKVTSYLWRLGESGERGVMAWNDHIAGDGEEVARMLRAVAAELVPGPVHHPSAAVPSI